MKNFTFLSCVRAISMVFALIFFVNVRLSAQTKPVNGKVIDAKDNQPIPGATVRVKNTTIAVSTNVNGEFTIEAAPGAVLQIAFVGYASKEVPAEADKNMLIPISIKDNSLDEVVVVGYGSQKRPSVTGAISTVSSKVFEDRGPTNNPIANLQGQVPGMVVTRTSAQPGRENWNFQIRGATSVNNQDPLIVLDGVTLNDNGALNSLNPNDIESMSVLKDASAAIYGARAAYGVVLITTKRAKPGAVRIQYDPSVSRKLIGLQPKLVGLKQWATGLRQALINDNYGVEPNTYIWYQYANLLLNGGIDNSYLPVTDIPGYNGALTSNPNLIYNGQTVPAFTDVKDFPMFDKSMTDILWGPSTSTQHNLSISGSTEKQGYRVSLGYLNDASQLQYGANGNQRYNLRLNHDYNFSARFKVQTNISLEKNNIQQPTMYNLGGYSALSTGAQPGIPAFTQSGKPYAWGTVYSPPGALEFGGDNLEDNTRINLNTNISYNFWKDLTFNATAGYNTWLQDSRIQQKQIQWYSYNEQFLVTTNPTSGVLTSGNNFGANYYRQNINNPFYNLVARITYAKTFAQDHEVSAMIGSSYERNEYSLVGTRTFNLANDDIPSLGSGLSSGTPGFITNNETRNHTALGSYFSRITYGYKGRYLLEAIGRYDGSSKFIADRRWKAFYGLEAAWRLSEESFIKKTNFFQDLKIRGTYGTTGNQADIGLYDYLQQLVAGPSGTLLGTNVATGVGLTGALVSLDRSWETVRKSNLGVDFSILNGHLSGSFDVFRNRNSNMLVNIAYPGVLGIGAPKSNDGELKTWGWESIITWKDKVGAVNFTISANITDSQNKLVKLNGAANGIVAGYNGTVEGYPLGSYFGLKYAGRLQTQEQVDAYNAKYFNPGGVQNNIGLPAATPLTNQPGKFTGLRPGDNSFADVNGDGKLSIGTTTGDPGDLVYLGTDIPRYTFGFNFGLQWKGFDFYTIFQGVGKRTIFRSGGANNWRVPYLSIFQSQSDSHVGNVWSPENPDAYFPNLHSAQNNGINNYNYQASTWSVENGAYLRLKNLVIGYTLPKALVDKTKALSSVRFYVSGSDLWEVTKIKDGWDPETTRTAEGNQRYPFYRYVTVGANLTF